MKLKNVRVSAKRMERNLWQFEWSMSGFYFVPKARIRFPFAEENYDSDFHGRVNPHSVKSVPSTDALG